MLRVIDLLHGLDVRFGGGWGVDVLYGEQTRDHHVVDLFVHETDIADAVRRLIAHGYATTDDDSPGRVVLTHATAITVDLNGVVYLPTGDGYQHDDQGGFEYFPRDCWATRVIGNRAIVCLSPDAQRIKHGGYAIRATDVGDLAMLDRVHHPS
jgi:lincosamide nucleotidyltransferase A/C/D/E